MRGEIKRRETEKRREEWEDIDEEEDNKWGRGGGIEGEWGEEQNEEIIDERINMRKGEKISEVNRKKR